MLIRAKGADEFGDPFPEVRAAGMRHTSPQGWVHSVLRKWIPEFAKSPKLSLGV